MQFNTKCIYGRIALWMKWRFYLAVLGLEEIMAIGSPKG